MFVTRRYRCLVFLIAVTVVVPALLGTRCSRRTEGDARGERDARVGGDAPVQSGLPDLAGDVWLNVTKPLSWDDLRGRPVIIEYWATWCAPCLANIPKLNGLQSAFADRGFIIIGMANDPPEKVASFAKRFDIRYAVCVGKGFDNNPNAKTIPYAVLISPAGEIVWEGNGSEVREPLAKLMKTVEAASHPTLLAVGETHGKLAKRPAFAEPYDSANLKIKLDAILDRVRRADAADCDAISKFYWQNLPRDDWPGDKAVRLEAIQAPYYIWAEIKDGGNPALLEALREEILRRLAAVASEPDVANRGLIARFTGYFARPDDPKAIGLLERMAETDPDGWGKLAAEESLEEVDSTRDSPVEPPSKLYAGLLRYYECGRSWKTKLLGYPKEFKPYVEYEAALKELLSGPITAATIQRLAADYKRHGTNSTSDLMIRDEIVEQAGAMAHQLSRDLRKALQEMFFAIVQQREQDRYLRYREVAALRDVADMSIGHDLLDREEQLKVIDALLAKEGIRDNRRVLESWRYALTRPGQGD